MSADIYTALYDALSSALAAPVYVGAAPSTATLHAGTGYVVVQSDTGAADVLASDADGALLSATVTAAAYASTPAAARTLGDALVAAMTDRAAVSAALPDGHVLSAALDLHAPGPDEEPAGDRPLGSRVVRARYRIETLTPA